MGVLHGGVEGIAAKVAGTADVEGGGVDEGVAAEAAGAAGGGVEGGGGGEEGEAGAIARCIAGGAGVFDVGGVAVVGDTSCTPSSIGRLPL